MIRSEFGPIHSSGFHEYCVRWDGYETKVDVTGNLTMEELNHLINMLQLAKKAREDECNFTRCKSWGCTSEEINEKGYCSDCADNC